ncbi:type VII secretion protein EssC [Lacrimispora sp. BS-2]|uniref:Type VII secretion protein EssC n=1 Tax=Lacrimispora sp. BS-2 TaxID=3151850 RepID=A0AAU7PJM4_9FIRM
MSVVLSVYSESAFKEYLLPAINNANTSIVLPKKIFGLRDEIELELEVLDNQWRLTNLDVNYQVTKKTEAYFNQFLKDKDLLTVTDRWGVQVSLVVREVQSSFAVFKKIDITDSQIITIGKKDTNIIRSEFLDVVSREHAVIHVRRDGCIVEDKSRNGTFVNYIRIRGSQKLNFGDTINVFGLQVIYLGTVLAIHDADNHLTLDSQKLKFCHIEEVRDEQTGNVEKPAKQYFHRSPRNIPKIESDPIEIEAPPAPKPPSNQPLFMTIGPAMTMMLPMLLGSSLAIMSSQNHGSGGAFMYTGLITAAGSAFIGTFWALKNMKYAKKINKEEENHRFEAYGEYLIRMTDTIRSQYNHNAEALRGMYLSANDCCNIEQDLTLLWNRNATHRDFLTHRLGIGKLDFQSDIIIPKEKFTLVNDSLAEKPRMIQNDYKTLYDVPVCVNLMEHQLLGIVGGTGKKGALSIVQALTAQITACDCYTDVKIGYVYDGTVFAQDEWEFARWLPHVWSEDKRTRFIATNKTEANDVLYEIANILRARAEETSNQDKGRLPKPYYVLFVANQEMLEGELITKYIYDAEPYYGITTVLLAENYEDLPNSCGYIIENTGHFHGMYNVTGGDSEKVEIDFDELSRESLEKMSRRLSGLEVKELQTGGEIPGSLTFFEMYGINKLSELNVETRWKKNRNYETMKALVGQKAGGVPCYLDVHEKYHGPHGLVAGTTGSGKSETLQTYMLSLAINFSPDDIGFFIIDYKGGGMANLFAGLPHMIGQISNLSGNQVSRAMVSIKSENMRRQRIFNEHGVNNINLYTRLYKNNEATIPVPHMFIIIDEFAELKREEPDFMRELISVAQVGRSLGVHLILSTQKPSGTVDDNIWSNSKFRLCLRVQDRQDSNDMLHKPDAAYITQAGRSYLQVGNDELYELFQSGWSGAAYDEEQGSIKTEIAKMLSINGKAAIVGSRTKTKQKEAARIRWIKQLVELIDDLLNQDNGKLKAILTDAAELNLFIDSIYSALKKAEVEYPKSDYNSRRLEDMLCIYEEVCGKYRYCLPKEKAAEVIKTAEQRNRKLPEKKGKTQLDAVVEYLGIVAKRQGYTYNLQLWLPILPVTLYLNQLEGFGQASFDGQRWPSKKEKWSLEAVIGLYDDPVNQSQKPLVVSFSESGHHAVCGTVVTGKSTFLQSLLYSLVSCYTPEHLNIYAIDFSSRMLSCFEGLAHTGGVMYEHDLEKIEKFFTMMDHILEDRKALLQGGNYSQYVQVHGLVIPSIVIAIDNFANFKEKTDNKYEENLVYLSREGVNYGIFLVVTSAGFGTTEIQSKIGDNIKTIVCLEMSNKFQYAEVLRTTHIDVIPEADVKGRGLAGVGGRLLEFQTALSLEAEDDYKRLEKIRAACEQMNRVWHGKTAKSIPVIPENPVWSEYVQLDEVQDMLADDRHLPIGYDLRNAAPYGIDLSKIYSYVISGKARTGKTNMLRMLMMGAKAKGGKICIIDTAAGELKPVAAALEAEYVSNELEQFGFFKALIPAFVVRNKLKKAWAAEDLEDSEIYDRMQKEAEKYYIFIADLPAFIKSIYKPEDPTHDIKGFLENITDKGRLHNVFFFSCFNQEEWGNVTGLKVFDQMVRFKTGLHLGGNVSAQRMFNFDYLPYMEQGKAQKIGIGLLPVMDDDQKTERIVIPLARG